MNRLIAVLVLLAGCRGVPANVTVPSIDRIDALEVQHDEIDLPRTRQVTEKERIRAFLTFVERVKSEEREFDKSWYTYPCSAYTVSAKCGGATMSVFWISPDHVGGRSPLEGERFLWPISTEEWRQLVVMLDLPTNAP